MWTCQSVVVDSSVETIHGQLAHCEEVFAAGRERQVAAQSPGAGCMVGIVRDPPPSIADLGSSLTTDGLGRSSQPFDILLEIHTDAGKLGTIEIEASAIERLSGQDPASFRSV